MQRKRKRRPLTYLFIAMIEEELDGDFESTIESVDPELVQGCGRLAPLLARLRVRAEFSLFLQRSTAGYKRCTTSHSTDHAINCRTICHESITLRRKALFS